MEGYKYSKSYYSALEKSCKVPACMLETLAE